MINNTTNVLETMSQDKDINAILVLKNDGKTVEIYCDGTRVGYIKNLSIKVEADEYYMTSIKQPTYNYTNLKYLGDMTSNQFTFAKTITENNDDVMRRNKLKKESAEMKCTYCWCKSDCEKKSEVSKTQLGFCELFLHELNR